MEKIEFLKNIEDKCTQVTFLSIEHIIKKIYSDVEIIDDNEMKEFFSNYKNYHLYLNDFAGVIYNRYGSSVDSIYIEMCKYLDVDVDNKYTLEHTIMKLEKQTPQLLLSLTDQDIQLQTIEHFDERLVAIDNSTHYKNNFQEYNSRVEKLKQNINLVKNALQIS